MSKFWEQEKEKTRDSLNNLLRGFRKVDSRETGMSPGFPVEGEIVQDIPEVEGTDTLANTEMLQRIHKMQTDIVNIKKTYKLPRNIEGNRLTYNEIFPDRDDRHCPKCAHDFGKCLQRAKRCPSCNTYLHVRYGHLLMDDDDAFYLRQIRLATLCWAYAVPDGPQLRSIESAVKWGHDELADENIKRFYEEIARII